MNPDERPTKRDAFMAFLREGWVSLHLDARRAGVIVPQTFANEPHLVLQYGRNMPIPIPDLDVTDEGVSATLSFSRAPHRTHVPWSSVYVVACTDGRGILYWEDVPQEVSLMTPPTADTSSRPKKQPITTELDTDADETEEEHLDHPSNNRWLRSVPPEASPDGPAPDEESAETPSRRRRRPQLRLVK
jgi:stringent starvation protein B